MGLRLVGPRGVHAYELAGQREPLALAGGIDGGHMRLRETIGLDRHLDSSLPLLLPGVLDLPIVVSLQRFIVRKLHGGDEIFSEQLQQI